MDTKQLRQKILDLAIRGKLVPQDPNDEPASVLLERVKAEKERLIEEGKIKRSKKSAASSDKPHYPFEIPNNWVWTTLREISNYGTCINVAVEDIPAESWVLELEDLEKDTARLIQRLKKGERDIKGVRHRFEKGNILYSKLRTYLNKVLVADNPGFCTTEIIPFSLFSGISEFYINLVLRSKYFVDYTIQCGFGVKMPRLSTSDANSGQIPLPPLNEQKRIVDKVELLLSIADSIEQEKFDLLKSASKLMNHILELAISGKLVPQDPNDEPAIELLKRVNPNAVVSTDTSHYQHLPQGWCVCKLEDIVDYEQPQRYIVESTEYSEAYKTPVLTAGKSFVIGHTNETAGVFDKVPVIIFDDFTTDSKYVDFSFKVKSSAMKILHVKSGVNIKYVYYFMSITRLVGKTHKRYWISEYSKLDIPLPPYNEQCRIVDAIERINNRIDDIAEAL